MSSESGFKRIPVIVHMTRWLMVLLLICSPYVWASDVTVMQDLNGQSRQVEDFIGKGKWTVVMIWASDCHVCNAEAGSYEKFHASHKDNDATMLGISVDGLSMLSEVKAFVARHGVSFPNLIDEPEGVARFYEAKTGIPLMGTPTIMVFSPDGEIRAAQVGAVPTEVIESFIAAQTATDNSQPGT